jgi:hypothetical protein
MHDLKLSSLVSVSRREISFWSFLVNIVFWEGKICHPQRIGMGFPDPNAASSAFQ